MLEDSWNVLHVIANHEKRVLRHLFVRSLEHYLPLYTERSQWKDRSVQLERPLFTGYVFVRFSPHQRLSVISTPGVIRVLGDTDSCRISPQELDRIREGLATGCILRPHSSIAVGTHVQVRKGVFGGVTGIVTEFRQQCKVVIRCTAVEQSFSLEVDRDELEVLGDQSVPLHGPAIFAQH